VAGPSRDHAAPHFAALLGRDALPQIIGVARDALRPRTELVAENALLRQQPSCCADRCPDPASPAAIAGWMVAAAHVTKTWETALRIVQPATLLRWHRDM
jgi:hypothetical protein